MSHPDRVWFIGDINESTYSFCCRADNIENFDFNTAFQQDVKVEINGQVVKKNLIEMPSWEAIRNLRIHQQKFGLKFKTYLRDSIGAKIVPWFDENPPKAKIKAQKKRGTVH